MRNAAWRAIAGVAPVLALVASAGCGGGEGDGGGNDLAAYGAQIVVGAQATERAGHDRGNVYAPDVLFDGTTWRMWYGGQGRDGHDRIHYAESTDGVTWVKHGVVLNRGTSNHVNDPSVVRAGDRWLMYYTDAAEGIEDRIHVAVSVDGEKWEKAGQVVGVGTYDWMTRLAGRPSVNYDGTVFRMWFDALSLDPALNQRYVGYATSSDGFTWTVHPSPVSIGGAVDVKRYGGGWRMLLEGWNGVYAATSLDGITWSAQSLLLPTSGAAWDHYGRVTPCAVAGRVYFGGAQSMTWDNNAICVVDDVPAP
jgi:hypothetical protein